MTKNEILEHLDSLTAKSPYGIMIKNAFDVDVPAGMPLYMQEHMYRGLMVNYFDTNKADEITRSATEYLDDLLTRFPWLDRPYGDIVLDATDRNTDAQPERSSVPDGTVTFCTVRQKFLLYLDGKIAVRCNTLDAVKYYGKKRHGCLSFNFVEEA
jgi:hypothetical protein